MVLPLSACPAAPAQGALAIECRCDDAWTASLLQSIDDPATRRAVQVERALLAQRGGGCHQRFGATQIEIAGLGALLYERDSDAQGQRAARAAAALDAAGCAGTTRRRRQSLGRHPCSAARRSLSRTRWPAARPGCLCAALFVAHRRALPLHPWVQVPASTHVWVPGIGTWQALAQRGVWVEGCGEELGFATLQPLLAQPLLQLPALDSWTILTHADAAAGWPRGEVIATYRHLRASAHESRLDAPSSQVTHVYWHSSAQFDRWRDRLSAQVQHACGNGKTAEHLQRAGVQNLRVFPQVASWRQWLGL